MKRRTFVGGATGLAALGAFGLPALAQKITGDVRFLCGFPPGGNADLLCRLLAEGARQFTRMPYFPPSMASVCMSPTSAIFAAP